MDAASVVVCTSYDIIVGRGLLPDIPSDLLTYVPAPMYAVVTDETVDSLYGARITEAFREALHPTDSKMIKFAIPPGEESKTRETKEQIEDWMLGNGCDRSTCIVAVGGGVVGDLAGFVAATFMRGIRFVHVPTTMLAMVDSSIGGKTGVDTPAGKNLVGAFHRPQRVYTDLSFLHTLPEREFCNGMAEVIKAGAIYNAELFEFLERNHSKVRGLDPEAITYVVRTSIAVKVAVVLQDEKEKGLRAILNFGHSIGHGMEALLAPSWLHGECVAVGMVAEAEVSRAAGKLAPDTLNRLISCLQAYMLPISLPRDCDAHAVVRRMAADKKNQGGVKRMVYLRHIGNAGTGAEDVEDHMLLRILSPGLTVVPHGRVHGSLMVPGSKSLSNRVLLMAALGRGKCRISNLLHSEDTKVMISSLQTLGISVSHDRETHTLVVEGCDGKPSAVDKKQLFLSNAGTATRFLTTACVLPSGGSTIISGDARMHERPIRDLVDALCDNGCDITYLDEEGCPPLRIAGTGLRGGDITLAASVSSQYVSSILISAPYAQSPVRVRLQGDIVSQPYIDMTVSLMRQFGVEVARPAPNVLEIPNTGYTNPQDFTIEGDASSASYPLAMAAITNGSVTVHGVGKNSLQGDARFCDVLEKMGCSVTQTADSTRVELPHGTRLRAVDVDMGNITDTFMTAAVLMATTPVGSVSRITNIANQRVKECNRIHAMATELGRLGVKCVELDDGLEIHGAGRDLPHVLHDGCVDIHCYNDHRIAMSFGVLGCLWKNIHITDKACTAKTYPTFWDDVVRLLGNEMAVAPGVHARMRVRGSFHHGIKEASSLVLIGMRGAGKTTLGRAAAAYLGYDFIDLDDLFEEKHGPIPAFIEERGWDEFRQQEQAALEEALEQHAYNTVVSCGGGVVETPACRELLAGSRLPIAWIDRHIDDIVAYLEADTTRPGYTSPVVAVYQQRRPHYEALSTHWFPIARGNSDIAHTTACFSRFCGVVVAKHVAPLRDDSCFLSLTFGDLSTIKDLSSLVADVDMVELRVDLLDQPTDAAFIAGQIALLRASTAKPILFTVRSAKQGGKLALDEDGYFNLLSLGARLGCDALDVETCWDSSHIESVCAPLRGTTIVMSQHFGRPCTHVDEVLTLVQGSNLPFVDVIKIVFTATEVSDCFLLQQARERVHAEKVVTKPMILLLMGEQGRLSRVTNTMLTPVTHANMPGTAAPGQLTWEQVLRLRRTLGLLRPRSFFIVGSPVALSPSPLMHRTGFRLAGLPWTYERLDTTSMVDVRSVFASEGFMGASVTMPFKQSVLPLLAWMDEHARRIGAVNTVVRGGAGNTQLLGFNTDWVGIVKPLQSAMPAETRERTGNVLVLGAGGTARAACYALHYLGFTSVYVVNRTPERAEALCRDFGVRAIDSAEALDDVVLIISTLPPTAAATVPATLLQSKPVVFDVTYIPRMTPLLEQAHAAGCRIFGGIDMLIAQGIEQQRLFTRRHVDDAVIDTTVRQGYRKMLEADPHVIDDNPSEELTFLV
ncbi:hypothetical protein PTSG_11780 [Salpingoeca rosetta]|uniref:Pentafunctional AROM polypeptide n=1 Tax=Salpingoeca rosetta (strain ATCC 50818 / BSB-021) TaxID=946362 RepID=F2TYU1_SALR5|nr:uncharacterized protein PTSG_11780 [Salpingoeca rosetta]EGD78765.1 hypothetical protein PTSG_11780 [Salpingoeca rosetta]|eukprot:XP_004997721.1 hypothetical protein PTSG_11780 [Salpingoeca rosetta]